MVTGERKQLSDEGIMESMTGLIHFEAADQRPSRQSQITHEVQNLVADAFVHIAETILIQNAEIVEHHRIGKRPALGQPQALKFLNVFEKAKSPGAGNILPKRGRVEGPRQSLLAHQRMRKINGVANLEMVGRSRLDKSLAVTQIHRPGDHQALSWRALFFETGLLEDLKEGRRAPIKNGNLGTIEFDQDVVDTADVERRHQMLDGGHRRAVGPNAGSQ